MPNPALRYRIALASSVSLLTTLFHGLPAIADITPANDGTGTTVEQNSQRFTIRDGTHAGANQFHSFGEFNLTAEQIAVFQTLLGTENVLGRVTSGAASLINGRIELTGSNANLFLMNPAGMIFGNGASLNVPGSFTATTATGIGFGDDHWFSAIGTNDYSSLLGHPNAFAFTTANPGALVNAGDLAVPTGEALTLMGGTVINTGTLTAPGGSITITAIEGNNLVRISQENSLLSLELETTDEAIANNTPLPNTLPFTPLDLPTLLTGGSTTHATDVIANADGTISLTSSPHSIAAEPGMAIASGILNSGFGIQHSAFRTPEINVLGDRTLLLNATLSADSPTGNGNIRIGGDYQGEGTVFNASQTVIDGRSSISADALDNGDGGRVIVWADDETGFFGEISARGGKNDGDGGFVEVSGLEFLDFQGLVDTTALNGNIGTLLLDPTNIEIVATGGTATSLADVDNFLDGDLGPGASTTINAGLINTALADVILQATNNIDFNTDVNIASPGTGLTAEAGNNITVNSDITTNGGNIALTADSDNSGAGTFSMNAENTITTNGGTLGIVGTEVIVGGINIGDGGRLTLRGDEINLIGGPESVRLNTGIGSSIGITTTPGQNIIVGGTADSGAANLDLTETDLAALQFTDGTGQLTIGSFSGLNGNVGITVVDGATPLVFDGNLALQTDRGGIQLQRNITVNGDVNFQASGSITLENQLEANAASLEGNEIDFLGGNNSIITDSLLLGSNATAPQNIVVGGTDNTTAALDITQTDLNAIQDDLSRLAFASGNGDISVIGDINIPTLVSLNASRTDASNTGTGSIEVQGANITARAIDMFANNGITIDNSNLTSEIRNNFNGDFDGINGGAFSINNSTITTNDNVTISGVGTATNNNGIVINTTTIDTGNGSIDLEGTGENAGAAKGVSILESNLRTTSGTISITGRGGDGNFENWGIQVRRNTTLETVTGDIEINGTGGNGTNISNYGVFIYDNANVTTADGNIEIIGQGGRNDRNNNLGIAIFQNSSITTTGSGSILLDGQGGIGSNTQGGVAIGDLSPGEANFISTQNGDIEIRGTAGTSPGIGNTGIRLVGNARINSQSGDISLVGEASGVGFGVIIRDSATITSGSGDVNVTGIGGENGVPLNNGIYILLGGTIETTNGGSITLNGTAGAAANAINDNANNAGVFINGETSTVRAIDGDIQITGRTNSTASNTQGIRSSGLIETTGNGNIVLSGTGGVGTNSNRGIQLVSTAQVHSENGDITLTGTGTGTGDRNEGIFLNGGVAGTPIIESTGTGDINLTGTGGDGVNQNFGVFIDDGAQVISSEGNLSVVGTGGNGVNQNIGIYITDGAQVNSNNSLSLTGIGQGSGTGNVGLEIDVNSSVSTADADLAITASDVVLDGPVNSGTGNITIRPVDENSTIGIGDTTFGNLNISQDELTNLNTTETVTIGNPITVDSNGQEIPLGDVVIANIDLTTENYDLTIQGGTTRLFNTSPGLSQAVIQLANDRTLQLISTGSIVEGSGLDIDIAGTNGSVLFDAFDNVGVAGAGGINARVQNMAARSRSTGDVSIDLSANNTTITTIGEVEGISTSGEGDIELYIFGRFPGSLTVDAPITANGSGNIFIPIREGNDTTINLNAPISTVTGNIEIANNPTNGRPQDNSIINLADTVSSASGSVEFWDPVITQGGTVTTETGNILFGDRVLGDQLLSINAGTGTVQFNDTIGNSTEPLLGLDIDARDVTMQAVTILGSEGLDIDASGGVAIANNIQTLNGGAVEINASQDISTAGIRTTGGAIALTSDNGDITATGIIQTTNRANNTNAGNGGDVSLTTNNGDITTDAIITRSLVIGNGNAGDSGDIEITASGNVSTRNLETNSSVTGSGNAGNGGDIRVDAGGTLTVEGQVDSRSQVVSPGGSDRAGNGGEILFSADDDINVDGRIISLSRASGANNGTAGDITVISGADVELRSGSTTGTPQAINADAPGQRGDIQVEAAGDIRILGDDTRPNSNSILAGDFTLNAGENVEIDLSVDTASIQVEDVAIDAGTDITLTNASIESTGQVALTAGGTITTDDIRTEGGAFGSAMPPAIALTAADVELNGVVDAVTGDITLQPVDSRSAIALGDEADTQVTAIGAAGNGIFSLDTTELTNLNTSGTVTIGRALADNPTGVVVINRLSNLGDTEAYDLTIRGGDMRFSGPTPGENTILGMRDGSTVQILSTGQIFDGVGTDIDVGNTGSLLLDAATGIDDAVDADGNPASFGFDFRAGRLAARTRESGNIFLGISEDLSISITDPVAVTIDTVGGVSGISVADGGSIQLGAGEITLNQPITVNGTGTVELIAVNGPGNLALNNEIASERGAIQLSTTSNGGININDNTALTTTGGDVLIDGPVQGNSVLTVDAETGQVQFSQAIGTDISPLLGLSVEAGEVNLLSSANLGASGLTIDAGGEVNLADAVTTFDRGQIDVNADGAIATNLLTTPGSLIRLTTSNTLTFNSDVNTNGGNLRIRNAATLDIQESTVTTNGGNFSYRGPNDIRISGSGILSTIGADINLRGDRINIAQGITLDSSQTNAGGGDISLRAREGEIRIGDINSSGRQAGDVELQANGNVRVGGINATGERQGGDVVLDGDRISVTDTIDTSSDRQGGDVEIDGTVINLRDIDARATQSNSGIQGGDVDIDASRRIDIEGNILTASDGRGGRIRIGAETLPNLVNTGDLITNGNNGNGGDVTVNAQTQIRTGNIRTRSITNNAGNVFIDPDRDVEVGFIDARGGNNGGDISVVTGRFFRATETFGDNNISISSNGGQNDGTIDITVNRDRAFDGVPFIIGDADQSGTAGIITTGRDTLELGQEYLYNFTLGGITLTMGPNAPSPLIDPPEVEILPSELDSDDTISEQNAQSNEIINGPSAVDPGVTTVDTEFTLGYRDYIAQIDPSTPAPTVAGEVIEGTSPSNGLSDHPIFPSDPLPGITNSPNPDTPDSPSDGGSGPSTPQLDNPDNNPGDNPGSEATSQPTNPNITEPTPTSPAANNPGETANTQSNDSDISLSEAQAYLQDIEQRTGVKPALLYAVFTPSLTSEQVITENADAAPIISNTDKQNGDRLELILVTSSDDIIRRPVVGTDREEITEIVRRFRSEILFEDTSELGVAELQSMGQQLYNWLIEPLQADLDEREIDNIAFLLDEGIRALPVAALHDGENYIINRYSVGLMPSLSLTNMTYENINNANVLAMGMTTFEDSTGQPIMDNNQKPMQALPATAVETAIITEQLWNGDRFMDEASTYTNLLEQRQTSPFGIVHLSTHADFSLNDPTEAYIQLRDRPLRLNEIRQLDWHDPAVELVVLSACNTAIGDENTELGFAGFSALAGVKSTLASLWQVDDVGTLALMTEFYQQLSTAPIKAEALRQAQLLLQTGQVQIENGQLVWSSGVRSLPESSEMQTRQEFSHPSYWAGFTIVGSPW